MGGFIDTLQRLWRALNPESYEVDAVVEVLDEWRTAFTWRGPTLTIDRRRQAVLLEGNVLAWLADVRSVDVCYIRADEDTPERWKVCLGKGFLSGYELGRTRIDVDASIAAARLATVLGVKVRSL